MSGDSRKGSFTCDLCGKRISERADTMYDGLCRKCFEREEEDADGIYEV